MAAKRASTTNTVLMAIVTAVAIAAPPALADERQWLCTGRAFGAAAAAVTAQVYVRRDGGVVGRGLMWDPPVLSRRSLADDAAAVLDLTIDYDDSDGQVLGRPTGVGVSLLTEAQLPSGLLLTLELGDGAKRTIPFQPFRPAGALAAGPTFYDSQLLSLPSDDPKSDSAIQSALTSATGGRATLATAEGRVLASAVYDLSGRFQVARLARQAWRQAEHKRRHPLLCDETADDASATSAPVPLR